MDLKITSNFSFGKVLDDLELITADVGGEMSQNIVETAAKTINDGKLKELKESTKRSRRKGRGWASVKVAPTTDYTPLKHTGALVNSLKVVKDGFEMKEYGFYHQKGFTTHKGQNVPARPFLPFTTKENLTPELKKLNEKITNRFVERIRKAMKK